MLARATKKPTLTNPEVTNTFALFRMATDQEIFRVRQTREEQTLMRNMGFAAEGCLLAANNKLVADGIARVSKTVLVPFANEGEEQSTAVRVAATIKAQARSAP